MNATAPQTARKPTRPGTFQPEHDQAAVLAAYQAHRASQAGTDGAFCEAFGIPEATFRRYLRTWRANAADGRHPLTGQPDSTATQHATALGLEADQIAGQDELEDDSEQAPDHDRGQRDNLKPPGSASLLATAQRIRRLALRGGKVTERQVKTAEAIIKESQAAGSVERESQFSQWSGEALRGLLGELAPDVLKQRKEPKLASLLAGDSEIEPGRASAADEAGAATSSGAPEHAEQSGTK